MTRLYASARARAPGLAWLGAAELAWHLAGPAWAFAVLFTALWWLAGQMPAAIAASAKAYAVEDRLNALVPKIPSPQAKPNDASNSSYSAGDSSYGASNSSYGASNSSYGMSGGTQVSYSQDVGNNGGANSTTSGQIGSAPAHYHSMTHYHTSSTDLQNWGNTLRNSHSDLVPAVNALRSSHSDLVPAVNALRSSHASLVPAVNALQQSHAQLINSHNSLLDTLQATRLLR